MSILFVLLLWLGVVTWMTTPADVSTQVQRKLRRVEFASDHGRAIASQPVNLEETRSASFRVRVGKLMVRTKFNIGHFLQVGANNLPSAGLSRGWLALSMRDESRRTALTFPEKARLLLESLVTSPQNLADSNVGRVILFALYMANLYAACRIATRRGYSRFLACGTAAIAPLIGLLILLCLPSRLRAGSRHGGNLHESDNPVGMHGPVGKAAASPAAAPADTELTPDQVFTRGQVLFNRRFFEMQFSNLLGVVRNEEDKDLRLVLKSTRGEFAAERITRLTASDVHLQVRHGAVTADVRVPFIEIKEVILTRNPVS